MIAAMGLTLVVWEWFHKTPIVDVARYSLLPPENATGNFVKVVQRIPVKIVLDPGQDPEHRLRPGMSVVPTVYTK